PEIVDAPAGLNLTRDGGFWVLTWSPTNDQAVSVPAAGYTLQLRFKDGAGVPRGQASLGLDVTPLFNDPPLLLPPSIGELALPASAFTEHRVNFEVVDPDRTETAPSCALTLSPAAGTSCSDPFASTRCEPTGVRS